MARISNITFAQVAQIADTMKASGARPTARAVRERIGSGSMGTIHKLLQQWAGKASSTDDEDEAPELPSSIANVLMDFVSAQIGEACEKLADELAAAKEAANALAEDNERHAMNYQSQGADLIRALEARAAEQARANALGNELTELKSEASKLRLRANELERELELSRRQTEMFASLQPELATTKAALKDSEQKRLEAEKNNAVLEVRLAEKAAGIDDLSARLAKAESRTEKAEADAKQANNHYHACAARLEAAAREIDEIKKKPKTAPTTKKTTNEKKLDGNNGRTP